MYDPKHWKHGINITVGEFYSYLGRNVPADAVIHICGSNQVYLHLSEDGTVFSVDYDSLSELPEYDGCGPTEMNVKEGGGT